MSPTPQEIIAAARERWPEASKIEVSQQWTGAYGLEKLGLSVFIPGVYIGDQPFKYAPTLAALLEEIKNGK